jgi:uncharacterized protein YqfA (UPF0365 family)
MLDLLASREFQIGVVVGIAGVFVIYAAWLVTAVVLRPWVMAKASGVDIGVLQLIGMKLRRTNPTVVMEAFVRDQKRGSRHSIDVIEAAYIAFKDEIVRGGDLLTITDREVERAGKRTGGAP